MSTKSTKTRTRKTSSANTLPSTEEIEAFISYEQSLGLAPSQIAQDLEAKLTDELPSTYFTPAVIKQLSKTLYSMATHSLEEQAKLAEAKQAAIAAGDIPEISPQDHQILLRNFVSPAVDDMIASPHPYSDDVQRLISAFLATALTSYHPSGWIHYDRKSVFKLAGLSGTPAFHQTELTQILHNHYELGLRVVGSNQPIPCFKFSWLTPPNETEQKHFASYPIDQLYQEILKFLHLAQSKFLEENKH